MLIIELVFALVDRVTASALFMTIVASLHTNYSSISVYWHHCALTYSSISATDYSSITAH